MKNITLNNIGQNMMITFNEPLIVIDQTNGNNFSGNEDICNFFRFVSLSVVI